MTSAAIVWLIALIMPGIFLEGLAMQVLTHPIILTLGWGSTRLGSAIDPDFGEMPS